MATSVPRKILKISYLLLFIALFALLPTSCSIKNENDLPALPVGNEEYHSSGKFIWFELLSEDTDKAIQFYSSLFNWRISTPATGNDYYFIENNGALIGGLISLKGDDPLTNESRWVSSLTVENVQSVTGKLTSNGGMVLSGPGLYGERGELALVRDPFGAEFVLLRTANGDPANYEMIAGNPVWSDLFTRDFKKSAAFYNSLIGFKTVSLDGENDHYYFLLGDKIRAGIVSIEWQDVTQNWLPYIGVKNLRTSVLKAISLGGTLVASTEEAAIIVDPTGAAIGMQLLPQGGTK